MACLSTGCPRSLTSAAKAVHKQRSCSTAMISVTSLNPVHCSKFNAFQRLSTSTITCGTYTSSSFFAHTKKGTSIECSFYEQGRNVQPLMLPPSSKPIGCRLLHLGLSTRYQNVTLKLSLPSNGRTWSTSWALRRKTCILGGSSVGLCVSFSSSEACNEEMDNSNVSSSRGKKVYRDYSITGIPGDGRCLFRSVVHGACIRTGKAIPDEELQRQLADELRSQVADEFIKRRTETEWFIEGEFETYVSQMRKPHVWGGEPELLMASHVLQMPITVYMHDEDSAGLIEIAEYGQEYGNDCPIRVLYHGYGHYDALQIPGSKHVRSRI